jgi:hypothetical protein
MRQVAATSQRDGSDFGAARKAETSTLPLTIYGSDPSVLLRLLRTRFKLDLEYLTPAMLRDEFKRKLH